MKVVRLSLTLVVFAFIFSSAAQAQREYEYWKTPNAPIMDFGTTSSSIDVPDDFKIYTLQVLVDIDHEAAADLILTLSGPSGTYTLSTQNGAAGANYENTIFDSYADPDPLSADYAVPGLPVNDPGVVTAYFRGVYQPESMLPNSGAGMGNWTLTVQDALLGDNGVLVRWGLIFNRYGDYRDIRWGWDLNNFGVTTWNATMPAPMIDVITHNPPYTVFGHRPLNDMTVFLAQFQLSQTTGQLRMSGDYTLPNNTHSTFNFDAPLPTEAPWRITTSSTFEGQKGQHEFSLDLMMRADLYMSRSDNEQIEMMNVTPGSLAFDNGVAANTLNPYLNECNAGVYSIYAPQTITSVDIWQGSEVELEPFPSTSLMSVNVWDANGILVASSGAYPFPPQGEKWVSYPISPPVSLPAGTYKIGYCMDVVDPSSAGPGVGMDQVGSPYEPLGTFSKYANFGLQQFSFDNGMSWFDSDLRIFTTQMIRPNFVIQSDVGVIAIYPRNSSFGLDVDVVFGAYAHYSWLPNQVVFGKVTVTDNSNNSVVGYQEKRVFLTATPWIETETFNFAGLNAGSYTIKAEIVRPDDENLINNVYSRQLVVTSAPMVVSIPQGIGQQLKDQIVTSYAQQGVKVNFVDRTFGFEFPQDGKILWVGSLNGATASQAREFVENGGSFEIVPTETVNHPLTDIFSAVANSEETAMMSKAMEIPADLQLGDVSQSENLKALASGSGTGFSLAKSAAIGDAGQARVAAFAQYILDRAADKTPPPHRNPAQQVVYSRSDKIRTKAVRYGDLAVVQLLAKNPKSPERVVENIVNPNHFELTQNYPNPFNPTTNIAYNVPTDANVSLRVYDMLGREVATLVNGFHNAGMFISNWDARNNLDQVVSSGVYLYRLEASPVDGSAPFISMKKMVLSR